MTSTKEKATLEEEMVYLVVNFRHSGQEALIQKMAFEERSEEVRKRVTPISVGRVTSKGRGVLRNRNK